MSTNVFTTDMKRLCCAQSILVLLCFVAGNTSAHNDVRTCSRAAMSGGSQTLWPDYPHRPYTVKKYQLTLDWRKIFQTKSAAFTGVNIISLEITDTTSSIELDASYMQIDSISINGTPVTPTPQPVAEKLTIPIPHSLQSVGTQLTVSIGFNRNSLKDTGIYFFPKGLFVGILHGDSVFVSEDVAYTMSEPTDAHYWMPCNDQPYNKAESEISIIVPNGIEAASNGTLVSKATYPASSLYPASLIWNWKSDEPIATYLMVADASTFIHWSQTHQRTSAPGDTVHLDYYAWPADYYQDSIKDGSWYNATYFLSRNTSSIMTNFESHYGGFPFVKYGQVPVQPFNEGGMEHQTLTTINRSWLRGYDQGVAHEMSHQWFGDKTTCETFKDIWLNEGFATFSEAIWGEGWGGSTWYMNIIFSKAQGYFTGDNADAMYDPPADNIFNYATTYCKGGCVLHMLRRMVNNDTMFFGALRDYSNAFAWTTANTAQLRDFLGGRLGLDLFEYFDQWVFGALHPIYDIKWAQDGNNKLFVHVNQLQTVRDHFAMPMRLFACHGRLIDTLIFNNDLRSQSFQLYVGYKIDSLKFDADGLVLSQYLSANGVTNNTYDNTLSTVLQNAPALAVRMGAPDNSILTVYPNSEELLCKFLPPEQIGMIELYNSVGMKIQEIPISAGQSNARIPIRNLASGVYFVRFTSGAVNAIQSISIVH